MIKLNFLSKKKIIIITLAIILLTVIIFNVALFFKPQPLGAPFFGNHSNYELSKVTYIDPEYNVHKTTTFNEIDAVVFFRNFIGYEYANKLTLFKDKDLANSPHISIEFKYLNRDCVYYDLYENGTIIINGKVSTITKKKENEHVSLYNSVKTLCRLW